MENRRLNSAAAAAMTAAVGVALYHSWQARAHKQAAESEMAVEAPKQLSVEKEDSKIETPGKCPTRERAQTGACSQGLEKIAPDFVCGPKLVPNMFDIRCSCGVAPESVLDDIGVDDEHATIVIIGGGPHALAALSALHEKSFAFAEQYGSENEHQRRVGFGSYTKVGTGSHRTRPTLCMLPHKMRSLTYSRRVPILAVCVLDPGYRFMEAWDKRFEALKIEKLRSPAFAHPAAFEPRALVNYAIAQGRTNELHSVDGLGGHVKLGQRLATTDGGEQDSLWRLPSTTLFRDFCHHLETKLPHQWISGSATKICKAESTDKYYVHYTETGSQRMRKVVASAVILATGPTGEWNVPRPFKGMLDHRRILHTEEVVHKGSLMDELEWRIPSRGRVLVIGGGLTAGQAALAASRANNRVVLRSRRPLQTRPFDISEEWLDAKKTQRLRFEFLKKPMDQRRAAVKQAVVGGSLPKVYMEELLNLSRESESLKLEVDENIDSCQVSMEGGGVRVNGEVFDQVILATGVVTSTTCSPLYLQVQKAFDAKIVAGLPVVNSSLRWVEDEKIFVIGANAMLEIGPGSGNLMGAMKGAKIIANELYDLVWTRPAGNMAKAGRMFTNPFSVLVDSDGETDE